MTWCVCWGGLYTVIGCTMYVDRWTCTLEPSSFNRRSALTFMWAWSFCWRSQPSTLYQVTRSPHNTSISHIPVWNLFRYNLSITGVFSCGSFASTSWLLSSDWLQRRRFSCLSSEIDEPLNADMYIHGSLPLLVILTFYIGYFWQVDLRPSSTQTPYRQSSWSPVLLFSWY